MPSTYPEGPARSASAIDFAKRLVMLGTGDVARRRVATDLAAPDRPTQSVVIALLADEPATPGHSRTIEHRKRLWVRGARWRSAHSGIFSRNSWKGLLQRAFAPVLAKNGGGAIINVLSTASWMNGPMLATYGASKSAAWALTNGLRMELAQQGTQVVGLHAGFIDTDLARDIDAPKSSPVEIVRTTLDALERGEGQVLADEITRQVHRNLSADPPAYFQSTVELRSRAGLLYMIE
jgi:hypothetical protein